MSFPGDEPAREGVCRLVNKIRKGIRMMERQETPEEPDAMLNPLEVFLAWLNESIVIGLFGGVVAFVWLLVIQAYMWLASL